MSHIIDFIEELGRDAQMRHATREELKQALERAHIDPQLRAALLAGDQAHLEALVGATPNVCCSIFPPKTDEDEKEKERKAKEDDKEKVASAA